MEESQANAEQRLDLLEAREQASRFLKDENAPPPPTNTHKVRAWWASVLSGLAYFVNWLATVPPEQQAGWLAELVEITPVEYRPNVALFTRFVALGLGIYAIHQASKSGPSSPPANNPNK